MHKKQDLMLLSLYAGILLGSIVQAAPSARFKPKDNPASVQGLLAALDDTNKETSALALIILTSKDINDNPQVRKRLQSYIQEPHLVDLLKNQSKDVRDAAIKVLRSVGGESERQIAHIVPLLQDPQPDVRIAAAGALGAMGAASKKQAPRLVELLQDTDVYVCSAAAQALGSIGEVAKEQVPRIADLLYNPQPHIRSAAAEALGAIGEVAKEQAPCIAYLLQDPQPSVRVAAAKALGAMGQAAEEQVSLLAVSMEDVDEDVRIAAVKALGAIGETARDFVSGIAVLMNDANDDVRIAAVETLGNMGGAARGQAPHLVDLLKDPEEYIRDATAKALGAMGEAAKEQVPRIVDLLKNPDKDIRNAATEALGVMGETAREQVPHIAALMEHPNDDVRVAAVEALGAMGETAREQVPHIAALMEQDREPYVRSAAARALGTMGKAANEQIPRIAAMMESDSTPNVRAAAAEALGFLGESAKNQVPRIAVLLKDPHQSVRNAAARALGAIGEPAKEQAYLLIDLLNDPVPETRKIAVRALEAMGESARGQASLLVDRLENDDNEEVRALAGNALMAMSPLDLQHIAAILTMAVIEKSEYRHVWLLRAHTAGGGANQSELILRWLSGREFSEFPKKLTIEEARSTLRAFAALWPYTERTPRLREDLARQIAHVTNLATGQWTTNDIKLLHSHEKNLKPKYPANSLSLVEAITAIDQWAWLKTSAWVLTHHLLFWTLLLCIYPQSPQIQAILFWNPWARKLMGFGYVGLLLTWVPFLRERLLAPFRAQLIADAYIKSSFSLETYFQDSDVIIKDSGKREPLLVAIPRLQGQVVLQGASGLGKSMFIKYLLSQSKSQVVFLAAAQCKDGVVEAIQAKLEGHAKDSAFLRSLIYSGALDIYIDGLNEVTADTRASIAHFAESNPHCNILLSTQRMEWRPPTKANLYILQPLSEERVLGFLISQEPILKKEAKLRGTEYREECARFVQQALSTEQPEERRAAMREVLSNPMDLSVVAQMLAAGHSPNLLGLNEQQYRLMVAKYEEMYGKQTKFPLKEFAEESFTMRVKEQHSLPEDRFGKELLCMEADKMVVCLQWKSPNGQDHREWRFRHDKLQEYFIAQTFMGDKNSRVAEHLDDPRFRGVYFLLALTMEPEKARHVRDLLVAKAARTQDHTVSDKFVTLLEERCAAEQSTVPVRNSSPDPVVTREGEE